MAKKDTKELFIVKARKIHGDRYDYSLVIYINAKTKVKIICPIHGVFEQIPDTHLHGNGCKKCSHDSLRNKKDDLIYKFNIKHDNYYDYSLVVYKNMRTKIQIICPVHGVFEQRPDMHLSGSGCIQCANIKKTKDNYAFKNELINLFGNKYDLNLVDYNGCYKKIKLICPVHSIFEQTPRILLSGSGCPKCNKINADNKQRRNKESLIKEFNNIHNYKFDYSLVDYINVYTKIKIICPEHGLFFQQPREHLKGTSCPKCKNSKGEKTISNYLSNKNINFVTQKHYDECISNKGYKLRFDFYLPDINTCIEYDGKQHYHIIDYFNGAEGFNERKINDSIKNYYCQENNITLIRIKYNDDIISILDKLLQK